MEITGTIAHIFDEQVITDTFRKREFVIEHAENPDYPQLIQIEFIQDKCSLLDKYSEGQVVTVGFNLNGRKWTNKEGVDKFFNTIQAWKISEAGEQQEESGEGLPF